MILVTPFIPGYTDYGTYTAALKRRGQCGEHEHLVITQRQDEAEATSFAKSVEKIFKDTNIKVIDAVTAGGPVGRANAMFKAAFYYFRADKGDERLPMLYGDAKWFPQKHGWMDSIQSEFFAKAMPRIMCRYTANAQGEKVTRGPVVMSRDYVTAAPLVPSIPVSIHWRQYLRHELANIMVLPDTISTSDKAVLKLNKPYPKKKK